MILTEVKKQLKLAGPLIVSNPLQYILQVISHVHRPSWRACPIWCFQSLQLRQRHWLHLIVSMRVSNELGAGNPNAVLLAIKVALRLVMTEGLFMALVILLVRNIWGHAFRSNEKAMKRIANMMPILAASNLLDGFQCVLSGVVRGCGLQKIGTYINLGSFYILGLPMAIFLGFILHIKGKQGNEPSSKLNGTYR